MAAGLSRTKTGKQDVEVEEQKLCLSETEREGGVANEGRQRGFTGDQMDGCSVRLAERQEEEHDERRG